ncbi:MAG TPA: hypothetical protein VMT32_06260 [Bryobacteraceae bacterium]|nr:hypothetical protein [Bryobacteraceae bacterium]
MTLAILSVLGTVGLVVLTVRAKNKQERKWSIWWDHLASKNPAAYEAAREASNLGLDGRQAALLVIALQAAQRARDESRMASNL